MGRLATYLSFIRFSHSVFALPFALTGALLAWQQAPFAWWQILWVIVAMVSTRSAAMGFNRIVDARDPAWRAERARRDDLHGGLVDRLRRGGVAVEPHLRLVVADRAGDRVLV